MSRIQDLRSRCRLLVDTSNYPAKSVIPSKPCTCRTAEQCELRRRSIANEKTHTLLTPAECNCTGTIHEGRCPICDGGLGYCKVCHAGEAELADMSCEERQEQNSKEAAALL